MMRNITLVLFLFATLLSPVVVNAQLMWPGDIDNNGRVGAADLLWLCYAFGENGPERVGFNNLSWAPIQMGEMWEQVFPDSTNFAYADISGNGLVDERDVNILSYVQGLTHGTLTPDFLLPPEDSDELLMLSIIPRRLSVEVEGNYLIAEVQLGRDNEEAADQIKIHGFGARLQFAPGILADRRAKSGIDADSWIENPGDVVYTMAFVDSSRQEMEFAITRRDHDNVSGNGYLMTISIPLAADVELQDLSDFNLQLVAAAAVDNELQPIPVQFNSQGLSTNGNCPFTVNPVCGIDGVTYLNSCFAEAAGVFFYTEGACYGTGIDVSQMDSTILCDSIYTPVCGFNQISYANDCVADAHGVITYSDGACGTNDFSCYDPNLIAVSSATTVNTFSGVITVNCPDGGEAVVGCDGNIYPNACLAEASGVRAYTLVGGSNGDCIDPEMINPDADCGETQAFVCGCSGYTYVNACYADAAGVTSYTNGPCGGSSTVCDEAVSIECGDYLPTETTIGAGNQITSYPGGTSTPMLGPDRVYVLQKTGAGDLQIGLEIMTPGLDMDVFLMRGDCNDLVCIASSTTSNTITNNEGIILEDAPTGTYYIIVDQQQAGEGGNYRLEVSCGYLDCSNSVPLNCGTTYNGTNLYGNDDVSLYTCGNTLNVENNGPEVVHTFTLSEAGEVSIELSGLNDNLELFLLSSCDRGAGLAYSQNSGNANESIVRDLPAGTYYVVVDGYNGAVSSYSLLVNCDQNCGLSLVPTETNNADCGLSNGEFNFSVYGGHPTYYATYTGPVSGSQVSNSGHFCFVNLPAGQYTYTVQDGNGCLATSTFIIQDQGNLQLNIDPIPAGCGSEGSLAIVVGGSLPPFTVNIVGPESATFTTTENYFVVNNLQSGTYSVNVVNSSGCSATSLVQIGQGNGNLNFIASPYPEGCGNPGRIHVQMQNGQPSYTVAISGTLNGTIANVDTDEFNIINLVAGVYQLTITDASGCSAQQTVVVPNANMDAQVSVEGSSCGNGGAATVNITAGTPPYMINYFGPTSGSINTNNTSVTIPDLPSGVYTFDIWDSNGCDVNETVYVPNVGGDLSLVVSQNTGVCNGSTAPVHFQITDGTPGYSMTYSGPESGTVVINGTGTATLVLSPGNYTFIVNDFAGCSTVETFTVVAPQQGLDVSANISGNACGQLQNITADINGGSPPFVVSVTNDCGLPADNFITFSTQFVIENTISCTYFISVSDANGCSGVDQVAVQNTGNIDLLTLIPSDGGCGENGFIDIVVNGGDDPYFITWTGPVSGNVALVSPTYRIENTPAGTYTVSLTTNDGCTDQETIAVNSSGDDLELISTLVYTDCGQYDQIWNDIIGGTPPYTVETIRLCDSVSNTMTITGDGFELLELIPCDYKIIVTDVNGCMTMNTVTVFPYQLFDAIPTPGLCGQDGSIQLNIMNAASMPPYQIVVTGPQNWNFSTSMTSLNLDSPAGTYSITITDAGGCSETETIVVEDSPSDLDLQTALIFNDCGVLNQLWNDIYGGVPPFTVEVIRLCDNVIDTSFVTNDTGFELFELDSCDYKVSVTDANGCMDMTTTTVNPTPPNFFTAAPISGPCGDPGRIDVTFTGGLPPFNLSYFGPQSGNQTVNASSLSIDDLPAGDYTITVTDANGCNQESMVTVVVTPNDLVIQTALILNDCGQYNQIWIDIFNGSAPYTVTVFRLCDSTLFGTYPNNNGALDIPDLPPCDYKLTVVDAAGCMAMDTITVFPAPVDIVDVSFMSGECNELGAFNIDFTNGVGPFEIAYTGPMSDTVVVNGDSIFVADQLVSGTYTVIITDANGCVQTEQGNINNTTTDLDLSTAVILNSCGQYNQLWNDIYGGVAPYTVELIRLCDNTLDTTFVTNNMEFELPNLNPCEYKTIVTDATGCMAMTISDISSTNAELADITIGDDCAMPSIIFSFTNGTAPYTLTLMGPAGQQTINNVMGPTFVATQNTPGDYMIMIESSEGCTEVDFISVSSNGNGGAPTSGFTFETANLNANFTNTSSGADSYLWDFDENGATSTDESPSYVFNTAGIYNVCLTAYNNCGQNTVCQEVIVTSGSLTLTIGDGSGGMGSIVELPVTIRGLDNLATLEGSLQMLDPTFGEIIGVTPVIISPSFNEENLSFSYFSNNPGGQPLMADFENLLFYLRVRISASSGQTSVEFNDSPVAMEVGTVNPSGLPEIVTPDHYNGTVVAEIPDVAMVDVMANTFDDQAINNVAFSLSPAVGNFTTTVVGDEGGYAHLGQQQTNEMYYLNAEKPAVSGNGLSTFGLLMGQRYILGLETPLITSPYQVIAGDVNCSGSFTTFDLHFIQQMILGIIDEVPGCPVWLFVHESSDMPENWDITNVWDYVEEGNVQLMYDTMSTFVGVRRGDILGNADPTYLSNNQAEARNLPVLPLQVDLPEVQAGQTFTMDIHSDELDALMSTQFGLQFDPSQISFLSATANEQFADLQVADNLATRGELNFSWFPIDGEAVNVGSASLVQLTFLALSNIDASSLTIEVASSRLKAMAHKADFNRYEPRLQLNAIDSSPVDRATAFIVEQNQPNPLSDLTSIKVTLPESGELFFTLRDIQGRTVLDRKQYYEAGSQQLVFNLGHLPVGLYHYQVRLGNQSITKKMLIQR